MYLQDNCYREENIARGAANVPLNGINGELGIHGISFVFGTFSTSTTLMPANESPQNSSFSVIPATPLLELQAHDNHVGDTPNIYIRRHGIAFNHAWYSKRVVSVYISWRWFIHMSRYWQVTHKFGRLNNNWQCGANARTRLVLELALLSIYRSNISFKKCACKVHACI